MGVLSALRDGGRLIVQATNAPAMRAVQRRKCSLSTMPSVALPHAYYEEVLTARYAEAVTEVNRKRDGRLNTKFYAEIGDAVFHAGCAALVDHHNGDKRLLTLSAPAGSGKTSFSYALIAGITREADDNPEAPYGCVFVTDQITKADDAYLMLSEMLPGQVAVWTSEHDPAAKTWPKLAALGREPAARFSQAALPHYAVAVVTHQFFLGGNGQHAVNVVRDGRYNPGGRRRALTIIDEQPQAVKVLDIPLSQAAEVHEKLRERYLHIQEPLNNLLRFMSQYPYVQSNKLFRPGLEIDQNKIREQLHWFGTTTADNILKSLGADKTLKATDVSAAAAVFQFAHLLSLGFGVTACENNCVHFCAWQNRLVDKLNPGTILMDATADISGMSRVVPWMIPCCDTAGVLSKFGHCACAKVDQKEPDAASIHCEGASGISAVDGRDHSYKHRARSESLGRVQGGHDRA
jgi:hypothetical protein